VTSPTETTAERRAGRMTGAEFRAFQATRPDHERWELLGGVPMMMTPPTIAHNQSNFDRLLNERLERYAPSLIAMQRPGLELNSGDHKPEPDVVVIDADYAAGQRFVEGLPPCRGDVGSRRRDGSGDGLSVDRREAGSLPARR
jgi:hypothetical protein